MANPGLAIAGALNIGGAAYQSSRSRSAERSARQGFGAGAGELRAGQAGFEQSIAPFLQFGQQAIDPLSQMLFGTPPQPANQLISGDTGPVVGPNQPEAQDLQAPGGAMQAISPTTPAARLSVLSSRRRSPRSAGFGQLPRSVVEARQAQEAQPEVIQPEIIEPRPVAEVQPVEPVEPQEPTQQQQLIDSISPLVEGLREEAFRDIQESAAARGRLGAGGTLSDLLEEGERLSSRVAPALQQQAFTQQLQSDVFGQGKQQQRFNQLMSALGLGANLAVQQGTARLGTAQGLAGLQGAVGQNAAQGAVERGNIIGGAINNLADGLGQLTPPPVFNPDHG